MFRTAQAVAEERKAGNVQCPFEITGYEFYFPYVWLSASIQSSANSEVGTKGRTAAIQSVNSTNDSAAGTIPDMFRHLFLELGTETLAHARAAGEAHV